jgi:hypothetical protein
LPPPRSRMDESRVSKRAHARTLATLCPTSLARP